MSTWSWSGPVQFGTSGQQIIQGTGSPEGVAAAPVGSIFMRIDGGANTSVYIKESGSGNTGWTALGATEQSPMTTLGDMIYGGTSGVPTRVVAGSFAQVPTVQGDGTIAFQDAQGGLGPAGPGAYNGTQTISDGYDVVTGDLGTILIATSNNTTINLPTATDDFNVFFYNQSSTTATLATSDPKGFWPNGDLTVTVGEGQAALILSASNDTFWGGGWWVLLYTATETPLPDPDITSFTTVTATQSIGASNYKQLYLVGGGINVTFNLGPLSTIAASHPDFKIWIACQNSAVSLVRNSSDQFLGVQGPVGGTGSTKPYAISGLVELKVVNNGATNYWLVTGPTVSTWLNINTQAGDYTIELLDIGGLVRMTSSSANNLTVPAESTTYFPVGTTVSVRQAGSGQTTIVADGGVTITTPSSLSLRVQNSSIQLVKTGTNTWDLIGDTA